MTGLQFHVEGPVGEFVLGRPGTGAPGEQAPAPQP